MRSTPAVAPLHPWLWPTQPWDRIHVDFAGPCQGRMLLVVTDAHSKWPEVFDMKSTTTPATIRVLSSTETNIIFSYRIAVFIND